MVRLWSNSARSALGTLLLAGAAAYSVAIPRAAEAQSNTAGSARADTLEQEVRERTDTAVQFFSGTEILETGQVELASALNELLPSAHFPRRQVADLTSGVRPFQLRGLSPDHTLVLLNGKRRHPTAVVHTLGGGPFPGASGVDMNTFPLQAIDRVEVARGGGATRHGSDAISGLIDVRLRNTISAPELIVSVGHHLPDEWDDDGLRYDLSANWGLGIGRRGVLNLTGAFSQREPTNRAGADGRDQLLPGDADFVDQGLVIRKHNDVAQPNHLWGDGESSNFMLFANFELPLGDAPVIPRDASRPGASGDPGGGELYAFGGYSRRRELHSGLFVRSMDDRNWPAIHPLGFLPGFDSDIRDLSLVAGFRRGGEQRPVDGSETDSRNRSEAGIEGGWSWDLNAQYGANRIDNDLFDTLNPSLGPCLESACAPGADGIPGTADDPGIPNRTRFATGALENRQFLSNADVWRRIDTGLGAGPLRLALGATFRLDSYRILEGEPASRIDGFHPTQSGGVAAAGSQLFTGYRPREAGSWNRSSLSLHSEVDAPLTGYLLASATGRYERFSGIGGTLTGRFALRVALSGDAVFRASVSTGFRPPALSQSHYGHVTARRREDPDAPGVRPRFETGTFPVGAPEARAVGASPLRGETSRTVSAGFALTPVDDVHLSIDGYATEVDDAIILSSRLVSGVGALVEHLLADYAVESIRFFSNAIDLRSYGVDAAVTWRRRLGHTSRFEFSASANWGQVRGRCPDDDIAACVKENEALRDESFRIYDGFDVFFLEEGRPDWRGVFKGGVSTGTVRFELGANYYGAQEELRALGVGEHPHRIRLLEPKVTFDAGIHIDLTGEWRLAVGGENLFDAFPTRVDAFGGIFPYRSFSAMGFNGRYLYARLQVS